MRAMVCSAFGDPETLEIKELPAPELRADSVRIKTVAAGVNFADRLLVEGKYQLKPPFPFIPGLEASGTVVEVAAGVTNLKPGDRVMAMNDYGMYAGQVVVPATHAIVIPDGMDWITAAGFSIAYGSSFAALAWRAALKPGETLVVLGAAGGVGSAAVEIGRAMGANVIAAVSTEEKAEIARRHGAHQVINYSVEDLRERVKALAGGADVVFDPIGGELFDAALRVVNWEGRIIVVGFAGGRIQPVPANILLVKNISCIGFFWGLYRSRDPKQVHAAFAQLFEWWREGKLKPLVSRRFDLGQAATAMEMLSSRRSTGKIVLTIDPGQA